MNKKDKDIITLAEELGELVQEILELQKRVIKGARFGIEENLESITIEWNDVLACIDVLSEYGISLERNEVLIQKKKEKMNYYNSL